MSDCHPFHSLLPPYREALIRYALKLTGNADRAEDLVQQTYLKAWANRDTFSLGTNLKPWLFTILRHCFCSDIRKYRREVQDVDGRLAAALIQEPTQEHVVALKEVLTAMASLPDIQRKPLVLMSAYGYSQQEAAAACKCTVGTIKSRVSRARLTLLHEVSLRKIQPFAAGPVRLRVAPLLSDRVVSPVYAAERT